MNVSTVRYIIPVRIMLQKLCHHSDLIPLLAHIQTAAILWCKD